MIFQDLKDEQFEEFLRSLKVRREEKITIKSPGIRTKELSLPKRKIKDSYYEIVGPGSYNPLDRYLSTKSKSPSIIIGKSNRFLTTKIPKLNHPSQSVKKVSDKSLNSSEILTPRYSFKRTGHNLKLVEDIDVPGVGKYSPDITLKQRAYSFKRSPRVFTWKKDLNSLYLIAEFEKKFWK